MGPEHNGAAVAAMDVAVPVPAELSHSMDPANDPGPPNGAGADEPEPLTLSSVTMVAAPARIEPSVVLASSGLSIGAVGSNEAVGAAAIFLCRQDNEMVRAATTSRNFHIPEDNTNMARRLEGRRRQR
jgi:hypothetical protein